MRPRSGKIGSSPPESAEPSHSPQLTTSIQAPATRPQGHTARVSVWGTLGVLAFQGLLVAVIYWPTRRLAFVSDVWAYLERFRQGAWATVATPIGYHWQPVACAWVWLIRRLFGERAAIYQAIDLLQLTHVGYLTYQLGRRLLDSRTAFLGSLLVLGSATFYEATYWPLAGNMHLLGAQFYVLAVITAVDVARGRFPRTGPGLLGFVLLAGILSHPAMVVALPVCALILVLIESERSGRGSIGRVGWWLSRMAPLAVAGGVFLVARNAFGSYMESAPRPGLEPERIYWLVRRGVLGLFSLRASYGQIDRVLALGGQPGYGTVRTWVGVGVWLIVACAAAAYCLWRGRRVGVRLLVAFLVIELAAVSFASPLTPRQTVIPAVPAALLTAWGLRRAAEAVAGRAAGAGRALCREIPSAFVLLLIVGAQADHSSAARVHTRVAFSVRGLVEQIRFAAPPSRGPVNVTLINLPWIAFDGGIAAFAFQNGQVPLAQLASPAVSTVDSRQMPALGSTDYIPPEVPALSPGELRAQVAEPNRIVFLFDGATFATRVLTAQDVDRLTAR